MGTAASGGQCALATTKTLSDDFEAYLQTEDGEWINYVDISLDLMSLGVGVASLPNALKSTSNLYRTSKYARYLSKVDKGKLVKTMTRMEELFADMPKLRKMFEKGLQLSNPAGKTVLTNNIIKRMLRSARHELRRQTIQDLSAIISSSLSSIGSYRGGVGSRSWGAIKNVRVEIYQFVAESRGS